MRWYEEEGKPSSGYVMQFQSAGVHNPFASTTYYFGAIAVPPHDAGFGIYRVRVPHDGFITWTYLYHLVSGGILASPELGSAYIRVDDTTDYQVSNRVDWSVAPFEDGSDFDYGATPVSRGQMLEFKIVTPAWTTTPTGVVYAGELWIER